MSVKFTDNSAEWANAVGEGVSQALGYTAATLADAMRENIGSEGGRAIATSRKARNSNRRKFKAIPAGESIGKREGRRYFEAAPPGNFPGTRTGALKRSMTWAKVSPLVYLVGSPLKYAAWLETGWERRKPLTDKQKRYLHALARELKNAGIAVTWGKNGSNGGAVWARPWLRRTLREEQANLAMTFADEAARLIAAKVAA